MLGELEQALVQAERRRPAQQLAGRLHIHLQGAKQALGHILLAQPLAAPRQSALRHRQQPSRTPQRHAHAPQQLRGGNVFPITDQQGLVGGGGVGYTGEDETHQVVQRHQTAAVVDGTQRQGDAAL